MAIEAINPATGTVEARYDAHDDDTVDKLIERVHARWQQWRRTSFRERASYMHAAANILEERAAELGELMAREMGKPVADGESEAKKCAWVCRHYADHARSFLGPVTVDTDAKRSSIVHTPLGVVLAVMPWNFPLWQVFRFLAPGLMAGNAGVLKHASNVPGCALVIEEIIRDAGFPEDVFRTLLIGSGRVERVIENPRIVAVTLTGSTPAGRAVASAAGRCLKKTVLELGGSDPYVILRDADLDLAVEKCAKSRLINSGQSCIAAKRFIVVPEIREQFEEGLVAAMREYRMGDPQSRDTQIGPQARVDLRDALHEQVRKSIEGGARCILGGEVPSGPGAFYPATVLTDVKPGTPAYEEELFGPVAAIIPVEDEEDAIRVANDTDFGLGAAVFSRDESRAEEIAAERLEAGCCFVNDFVRSDPRLPFGGIKESGYGRELAAQGIREFVNVKTVYVGS